MLPVLAWRFCYNLFLGCLLGYPMVYFFHFSPVIMPRSLPLFLLFLDPKQSSSAYSFPSHPFFGMPPQPRPGSLHPHLLRMTAQWATTPILVAWQNTCYLSRSRVQVWLPWVPCCRFSGAVIKVMLGLQPPLQAGGWAGSPCLSWRSSQEAVPSRLLMWEPCCFHSVGRCLSALWHHANLQHGRILFVCFFDLKKQNKTIKVYKLRRNRKRKPARERSQSFVVQLSQGDFITFSYALC